MKKTIKIVSLALCIVMCISVFASCSGETLMSYGDKKVSVNMYEFLLSRMKGTLAYYGYDVYSESFWMTIISSDGTTWEDHFKETVKKQLMNYVVADKLFDDYGLELTDKQIKIIDDRLDEYVKAAGSGDRSDIRGLRMSAYRRAKGACKPRLVFYRQSIFVTRG